MRDGGPEGGRVIYLRRGIFGHIGPEPCVFYVCDGVGSRLGSDTKLTNEQSDTSDSRSLISIPPGFSTVPGPLLPIRVTSPVNLIPNPSFRLFSPPPLLSSAQCPRQSTFG